MRPEHVEAVQSLLRDALAGLRASDRLAERFRWSYDAHPDGGAHTIVALDADQRVVGCGSAYPRRIRVAREDLLAAIPADFAVASSHRMAGAALAIQRGLIADEHGSVSLFFGFPNKSALPVLRRLGYAALAPAQYWVKPLRAGYKLRKYLGADRLVQAAAAPVDVALAAVDWWRGRSLSGGRSEVVDRADGRFDELWLRARDH